MEDAELIALYLARDEQAIRETEQKYGKLCFRLAHNVLGNNEDAEECVNDAYLGVWNRIPPTRPADFTAFLCKIVRNLSLKKLDFNLAEKRNRELTVSLSELEALLPDGCAPEWECEDLGRLLSDFLRQETEDARRVFLRRYYFFDSVGEIARRYSFSESKVKSMLFHTRNRLRRYLRKEGIMV